MQWEALFAENNIYELYNLDSQNKGLICRGIMCGEILNSFCWDFFGNSLFEVQWILSISNSQGTNKFVRDRESSR